MARGEKIAVSVYRSQAAEGSRGSLLLLILLQTLLGVSGVFYALILRDIINAAAAGEKALFVFKICCLAALFLTQLIFRAIVRSLEEYTRSSMENRMKNRLFSVLLKKDFGQVTGVHTAEWMNRITSDTTVVADGMCQIIPGAAGMAVKLAGAVVTLVALEPKLCYVLVLGGSILIIFSYSSRRMIKRLHKKTQEADGRLRMFLQERLESMLVVRVFAIENTVKADAFEHMTEHQKARMKKSYFSNFCNFGFGVMVYAAYVLGAVYCGYGILLGTLSYGTFSAVMQLIGQLQAPFANISGFLPRFHAMNASIERLLEAEEFADESDIEILSQEKMQDFYENEFTGISFEDVSFAYPALSEENAPDVITNFNLNISKGEYAAFTGHSGCGKSTVLKLILCLYPLNSGQRLLKTTAGSIELTAAYRRLFSYVPQGNYLFSGTVRDIITFGEKEDGNIEAELWEALETACAAQFIKELDSGLETLLGEKGVGLSEGQIQRIAIARAVFSKRPIILLDEATSSLDELTEAQVLKNLRKLKDRTVLIITHRPAVLQICDKKIDFEEYK